MFLLKRKSKTEKKEKDKNKNSLDGKYIEHNFTEKEPDVKIDFELDHPEVIKNITELKPNTIKNTYVTSKSMKLSENEQPNLIQEQSVIVVKKEKVFSSNPVKNVGFIIPADDEKGIANTKIGSGDLKSSKEIPPKIGFQVPANLKESDSKRSSKEQKYVFPFYQQSYIKKELDKKDSPVSKYVSAMYPPYQRNYDPIKTPLNPVHADLEIKKTKPTSRKSMPFINVSLIRVKNFDRTRSDGLIKTNLTVPTLKEIGASTESIGKKLRSTGVTTTECFVGKKIYKYGERGTGTKSRGEPQDFQRLRDECLERGVMFEDPEFPPTDSSLFFSKRPDRHFEWLRPGEIVGDPRLFMDGYSRFDVQQGELGDCWLLAAVANLTLIHKRFFQIVPDDQSFHDKYAGIFHFRFWQYGRWIDVVIDDRLPTYRGELVFLHSSEKNEFWSALLEKAYAKLHGSYEALKGGSTCEAMEDFTGGVTEMYELQNVPPNLFKILLKAYERNSLMGCSIEPDPGVLEAETPEGLIRGHAYSITRVKYVEIETPNSSGKIPLIRLRNPWGNEAEWNGPWSDKSPEWRFIPDHTKEELGLNFDNDGEFWMSYRDFTKHFDRLEICNLSPDALTEEDVERGKKRWEMSVFEGEWVRGVTAGGCRNYIDTFHHNPQYRITLTEVDDDDEDNKCTVIVALMQKNRRALRNMGADCLTIGFAMYYLPNPDRVPTPLDMNFFKYNASVARSPTFINLREVSCRFKLPPGTYCIVPSTFEQNEEAEFLLRVFSENKNHMQENDEEVGTCDMDDRVIQPQEPDEIKDDPRPPPQPDDKVREFFLKLAGDDMEVDWMELKEIMDYAMRNELPAYKRDGITASSGGGGLEGGAPGGGEDGCGAILQQLLAAICSLACKDTPLAEMFAPSTAPTTQAPQNGGIPTGIIETQNRGFSKDVCRSMIAMMDKDGSGKLGFEEFKTLWMDIRNWRSVFHLYDRDHSGLLSAFELRQALNSAGYKLNNHILGVLVHRYGTKEGYIAFDDFIMCAVKLKTMIDNPDEYDRFMNEGAQLTYGGYSYNYT